LQCGGKTPRFLFKWRVCPAFKMRLHESRIAAFGSNPSPLAVAGDGLLSPSAA
jgi:hypothetical protein